ncbi:MAG: hypothetical protein AABW51_04135 [Nanoarchaeota archaeon]|mgnify:CR=1 FL=1
MGIEERCLHQLTNGSASSNNIYCNGCHGCSYDPTNNPRCSGYFGVRVMTIEVREETAEKAGGN